MHLWNFDGSCTLFSQRGMSIQSSLQGICWGLCSLMLSPGLVVTRLNTYNCDDDQCCHHSVYICVCSHLRGQAVSKIYWPCALPLIGIRCVCSVSFQNTDFQEGFGATGMLGLSLALGYEECFSSLHCGLSFQLFFLVQFSLFVFLYYRKSSAFPSCLLAGVSHLEQHCLPRDLVHHY